MGRPQKRNADWFPHDANAARQSGTIEALETLTGADGNPLGNNGYAFWFKLLEMLTGTDGMFIDCSRPDQWMRLTSRARLSGEDARTCLDTLATMGAIDRERWEKQRVVWCPGLIARIRTHQPRRCLGFAPPLPEEQKAAGSAGADIRQSGDVEETAFGPVTIDRGWQRVEESYADQIGELPMGKYFDRLMDLYSALGANIVILAIEYTNQKQPDNMRSYLMQILENWKRSGVTTVAQAQAQITEHEKRSHPRKEQEPPPQREDAEAVRWVD